MSRMGWYVGKPNGIVLCVDIRQGRRAAGRLYHAYSREAMLFLSMEEAVLQMEQFFDELNFPYPTTNSRRFQQEEKRQTNRQERRVIMKDEELLSQHGDLGTFLVHVQHRKNSSWQGRITWMDQNKTVYFRSALEMMKLVADALDSVSNSEDSCEEPSW